MKQNQLAAQLYTIREFIKTPSEIAASLAKIKGIGYDAVQVSGMGPIPEEELARILEGEGLSCCATHEPGDMILNHPEAVAERLARLDCRFTAYPFPSGITFHSPKEVSSLARRLERAGSILNESGVTLTYHNHHIEFRRLGGKTILERLYEETDPLFLKAEIDTYWVQYGGQDPAAWCRKLEGRLPLLHLKDYAINTSNEIEFAEVGGGNLDWPEIITAAEKAGCLWFIVEQDVCPGDPFDSLSKSLQYIKENLLCT